MTLNNEQLRLGIIEKLKQCNAYIDNELPDYIMVMLVNKKTFHQISSDLQLFLGDRTPSFIDWLQEIVAGGGTTEVAGNKTKLSEAVSKTKSDSTSRATEDPGDREEGEESPDEVKRGVSKRRKSEDELELHPTLDWEEEREGGGERSSRNRHRGTSETRSSRKGGRRTPVRGEGERRRDGGDVRGEGERRGGGDVRGEGERRGGGDVRGEDGRGRSGGDVRGEGERRRGGGDVRGEDGRRDGGDVRGEGEKRGGGDVRGEGERRGGGDVRGEGERRGGGDVRGEGERRGGEDVRGEGERRGGGDVRGEDERRSGGDVRGEDPPIKPTHPIKLSKRDDLRILIARKKGERSAPPIYPSSRRYSHSGSEGGEEEEEEEGEGVRGEERGRKRGLSSVVKVPERTQLSNEGGGRLLARAIKGLAPPHKPQSSRHHSGDRGRRGGSEERRRELGGTGAGGRAKKRKSLETHSPGESRVKLAVVEGESGDECEGVMAGEGEGEGEEEVLPLTLKGRLGEKITSSRSSDDTTRKVELAVITALRKVLPDEKELTDLRYLINQQREKTTNTKQETKFVVSVDGVGERYSVTEEEGEGEGERGGGGEKTQQSEEGEVAASRGGGGGGGMPERCRFWPNCRKADSCPFHHPSAQCRTFPNCKYGNKCLFIHPQCKFDSRCTRSDCPYLHTAPRHVLPRGVPTPPVFSPPPAFPPPAMKFPAPVPSTWSPHTKSRYPSKAALTWTPGKASQHISQRKFAVPEEETKSMAVK